MMKARGLRRRDLFPHPIRLQRRLWNAMSLLPLFDLSLITRAARPAQESEARRALGAG